MKKKNPVLVSNQSSILNGRWLQACGVFCCLLLLLTFNFSAFAEEEELEGPVGAEANKIRATRLMELTGDSDFSDERSAWDKTYNRKGYVFGKDPADFLVKNIELLPKGRALDIATGEGRNAVYLAKKGFQVEGVDISVVGLRKARKLAGENGVKIVTVNADLNKYRIKPDTYTTILNFYYLQRNLIGQIKAGLKKGGVVVFETYTTEHLKNAGAGTWEREYLLEPGELKKMFSDFKILHYSESNDGRSAIASLIAQKTK